VLAEAHSRQWKRSYTSAFLSCARFAYCVDAEDGFVTILRDSISLGDEASEDEDEYDGDNDDDNRDACAFYSAVM
jgi:hypothetical protein